MSAHGSSGHVPGVTYRNPATLLDSTETGLSQISIVAAGRLAFVSGQTATPLDRGEIPPRLEDQGRVVAGRLAAALVELGASPGDIASLRVHVVDATTERFEEAWRPIRAWLDGALPSMTGIGVQALWTPALQLEVEMVIRLQ